MTADNGGTLRRVRLRFERDFAQIPNAWLRDRRLSRAARGLLAELMTHSDGFELSINGLATIGLEGRDAIRTMVTELERVGYLKRTRERRSGRFGAAVWTLCDPFDPVDNSPAPELPGLENPRSTNGGISNVGAPNVGATAPEDPTTKEDQIKKISSSKVSHESIAIVASPTWTTEACPGNWRDGVHELGSHRKCRHCHTRPLAVAA